MADIKETIVTGKARLSFVNVITPRASEEGKTPKYSVSVLIPKSDKTTVEAINKAIDKVKANNPTKFGAGTKASMIKGGLRDGDEERDDPAYAGHYFINASSVNKPTLFDENLQPVIDPDTIYSGVYAKVKLSFYPYNQAGSKGVAAGLQGIAKVEDGEKLAGAGASAEDFMGV